MLGIATGLILLSEFDSTNFTLNDLGVDVGILDDLGLDTSFFKDAGIETLSLETLGVDETLMDALGIDPDAPFEVSPMGALGIDLPPLDNLFAAFNLNHHIQPDFGWLGANGVAGAAGRRLSE